MKRTRESHLVNWAGVVCVAVFVFASPSFAAVITLVDNNSVAQIDPTTPAGMFNWFVDGQDQLTQQWFWYRVGTVNPEQPINTISAPILSLPDPRTLYTTYNNGLFSVEVDYILTGSSPGSGISDIGESIRISNLTGAPLDFHFFQYSDFDLLGTAGGDSVQLGQNLGGKYNEALQVDGSLALTETVVAPGATHGEVALFPVTLNKLNDGSATVLSDNAGPVTGDATWALQWDLTIPAGGTALISKDKYLQIIPEPTSVTLVGFGLLALLAVRRRGK